MNDSGITGKFFVRYGIESCLTDEEFSGLIRIEGIVLFSNNDLEDGTSCGRIRAHILRASDMIDLGFFNKDSWEEESELSDIASLVYCDDGKWSSLVLDKWPDLKSKDLIVIEEIFIDKKYRGLDFGLAIAERTIAMFGKGCALAVVSPWPTEISSTTDENEINLIHLKLTKHCERLGFSNINGTDLWARSLEHPMKRNSN